MASKPVGPKEYRYGALNGDPRMSAIGRELSVEMIIFE
jgi:hypothetical protein